MSRERGNQMAKKNEEVNEETLDKETEKTLENSRWRVFSREWIAEQKGDSLDISWLKDSDSVDAENLAEPQVLAAEAMAELTGALQELNDLLVALGLTNEEISCLTVS